MLATMVEEVQSKTTFPGLSNSHFKVIMCRPVWQPQKTLRYHSKNKKVAFVKYSQLLLGKHFSKRWVFTVLVGDVGVVEKPQHAALPTDHVKLSFESVINLFVVRILHFDVLVEVVIYRSQQRKRTLVAIVAIVVVVQREEHCSSQARFLEKPHFVFKALDVIESRPFFLWSIELVGEHEWNLFSFKPVVVPMKSSNEHAHFVIGCFKRF